MTLSESYLSTSAAVATELGVDPKRGLTNADVEKRRAQYGSNIIEAKKKINPFKLFFGQFQDFLIRILIVSGVLSIIIGVLQSSEEGKENLFDGLLILFIVLLVAIVGFLNEYKAEKTIEALKKLIAQKAKVIRDGDEIEIDAKDLVPGDIVLLEEGEKVPADIRLLEVINLQAIESSLTGESKPTFKNVEVIQGEAMLGDRKNMVFSSTNITSGKGTGVVVGTGSNTEIGRIATMVEEAEEEETPMQKKLDALGHQLGNGVLLICVGVFLILLFFVKDIAHLGLVERLIVAFIAAVALAVAAIPEGLAFVVRISLALGARRMAKRNALIRKLPAVEALGSTDVICSDKTGTLTKGEMTVRELWTPGHSFSVSGTGYGRDGAIESNGTKITDPGVVELILRIGVLCNNAHYHEGKIIGDPTEGALLVSAAKAGMERRELESRYPRVFEVPFTSDRKTMSTVHKISDGYFVAVKGATEMLLQRSNSVLINGSVQPLTEELSRQILNEAERMSKEALRVLLFAYKEVAVLEKDPDKIENGLIVAGLQGMMDPPREEIRETIERVTKDAGMKVVMITGDHIDTARAVAHEIGLEGEAITGLELDQLSQEQLEAKVDHISVYARVNPAHKIRIVEALKKHGHQVAMTGDGVNDAPAIKASDIGIAMGITGTDVAKETADLILLDDNFLSIVNAVEEGRGIFDNVRKFVNYLISCNIAEVMLILFGSIFFGQLVLSALQLLWINIVTDGLPAIALGSDPAERGIMKYSPKRFQGNIVNKRLWIEMFVFGFGMSAAVLYLFSINIHHSYEHAVAVTFTATVILEMVRLVNIRSDYRISWKSNPLLLGAIGLTVISQFVIGYIPILGPRLKGTGVDLMDWGIILVAGALLFVLMKLTRKILDKKMPLGVVAA